MSGVCERLDWDSRFFGFPVARVTASALRRDDVAEVLTWCEQQRIRCLYFLADSLDAEAIRAAEFGEFQLVDVRVTCRGTIDVSAPSASSIVRAFTADDLPAVCAIARSVFAGSTRFFVDTQFPEERAAALYDTWIRQSCAGGASRVLVADVDGVVAGFITCHLDAPGSVGRIGLTGVAANAQGRGVGAALVASAVAWCRDAGARSVSVVTQGSNIRSQRLYQRFGLRTQAVQLWYHRWFEVSGNV